MPPSKIIFFDQTSNKPNDFPWGPNTWKTRFTLNYKGIPFETVWLEYPEVEAKCKQMGIPPSATRQDGSPFYSVPSIWDPLTETGVSDSYRIAEYLDKTYPDTPPVLFDGIEAYDRIIKAFFDVPELRSLLPLTMPAVLRLLNPVSVEYKISKGSPQVELTGVEEENAIKEVKKGFDIVDGWLQENSGPFARGDQVSFVDFAFGGFLNGIRMILGEDSKFWQELLTWNEGRWGKYIKELDKYVMPTDS